MKQPTVYYLTYRGDSVVGGTSINFEVRVSRARSRVVICELRCTQTGVTTAATPPSLIAGRISCSERYDETYASSQGSVEDNTVIFHEAAPWFGKLTINSGANGYVGDVTLNKPGFTDVTEQYTFFLTVGFYFADEYFDEKGN
jgi:hypothetical protein